MVERINQTLERLKRKGFNGIFNGNNFDLIDNQGRCLNSDWGIDFDSLEEYSLLEHYFTIGEKVIITNTRSKTELQEWFEDEEDDITYREGSIGFIDKVACGEAAGIGCSLLFDIRIQKDKDEYYIDCLIPGDFEYI